jgi:hypothetical protein
MLSGLPLQRWPHKVELLLMRPKGNTEMTEEQIERIAECKMDQLDAKLLNGKLSQAEYDAAVKELSRWLDSLSYPK